MGIAQHLQVQKLLQVLPDNAQTEDVKLTLVPLLAQSAAEQERLYGVFDNCVKQAEERQLLDIEKYPSVLGQKNLGLEQKDLGNFSNFLNLNSLHLFIFTLLVLMIAVVTPTYFYYQLPKPPPITTVDSIEKPLVDNLPEPKKPQNTEGGNMSYFVDNKPYPFPNHLDDYDIEVSPTQQWLSENWYWLRWLLFGLLTAVLGAILWYRAWKRQQLVAQQDQNDKPPYFWNIRMEGAANFLVAENVEQVAQLLRRRADSETQRLDIAKTIAATIEKGGLPSFCFKTMTP